MEGLVSDWVMEDVVCVVDWCSEIDERMGGVWVYVVGSEVVDVGVCEWG